MPIMIEREKMEFNMLKKFISFRLAIIVIFFALSGCISQAQSEKSKPANLAGNTQKWTVLLSISGGIAGWMKNISVDSAGILIINDLKRNKSIRNKVNNNELAALSDFLVEIKELKAETKPAGFSKGCADCFNYELSIRWQNRLQHEVLNDINLNKSRFSHIVVFLRKIATKYEK